MNLTITALTMVDLTHKEAKRISFSPEKNLVTSAHNHFGKSVIMKSIYYTLGAEVYYSNTIKKLNFLTYMDFSLDKHKYRVARLKNTFALYKESSFIACYSSVSKFEDKLKEIFELEISLISKDKAGTVTKCPPVFYYVPYYVDQENGWAVNSSSFDKLAQFDLQQRKNSYFFHLGALDNDYVEALRRKKSNSRQIEELRKEKEKYGAVIETLRMGFDDIQMSFDTDSLEKAIERRKYEIKRILDELTKMRTNLLKVEDELAQLIQEKEVLSKYIKKKSSNEKIQASELIECPRCGMIFEQSIASRLEKEYLRESLFEDYTETSSQQITLEKKREKLKDKFKKVQEELKKLENGLASDCASYNAYIKSKATKQLLDDYKNQIKSDLLKIDNLRKDNSKIAKKLTGYEEEKKKVNVDYQNNLDQLLTNLEIPREQVEEVGEPGSSLVASGAYGPRCKIAQILAFVETQYAAAPNIITFPIVIDSPNILEQDDEHLENIMRTLFTWNRTKNQIIIASIHGKDVAEKTPNVNIITLENPQNHLFNTAEYEKYESEIAEIFTRF